MKKRNEIEEKYKWDLSSYAKDEGDCLIRLKKLQLSFETIEKFRGKLNTKANIYKCLEESNKIEIELTKLRLYAQYKNMEDGSIKENAELNDFARSVYTDYDTKTNFILTELSELSNEFLNELITNKQHPEYKRFFESILRQKNHTLTEKEENILTEVMSLTEGFSNTFDMFNNLDIKFEPAIDSKGKKHELNYSTYRQIMLSRDKKLRLSAYINLGKPFIKFENTISSLYINSVKADCTYSKIKKYKSTLEGVLYNEEITEKVYHTLIKKVSENVKFVNNYFKTLAKILGEKTIDLVYIFAPITKKQFIKKMPYETALLLVKNALAPLGQEYINIFDMAIKNRWIDVYPTVNKDNIEMSNSTYGVNPVVFLRYDGNYGSVSTIAHELGHAIHSYYSDKNQHYANANYPIFLAEIASTTNEVLLNDYLIKNAKTKEEKIYYLDKFLDLVFGTIFVQTLFAEFEELAHKKYEQDKNLSKDYLLKQYKNLLIKYYGKKTKIYNNSIHEWSRVPHFYNSFYVYKYATGLISAIKIASGILNNKPNAKEKYLQFLSSGSSKPTLETLKLAGVDLENEETFDEVFKYINEKLEEFKQLTKKDSKKY